VCESECNFVERNANEKIVENENLLPTYHEDEEDRTFCLCLSKFWLFTRDEMREKSDECDDDDESESRENINHGQMRCTHQHDDAIEGRRGTTTDG
jgi:hypothetical protein